MPGGSAWPWIGGVQATGLDRFTSSWLDRFTSSWLDRFTSSRLDRFTSSRLAVGWIRSKRQSLLYRSSPPSHTCGGRPSDLVPVPTQVLSTSRETHDSSSVRSNRLPASQRAAQLFSSFRAAGSRASWAARWIGSFPAAGSRASWAARWISSVPSPLLVLLVLLVVLVSGFAGTTRSV